MYLVTASEMQGMDRKTIEEFGLPGRVLMENAGKGATQIFLKRFDPLSSRKVGILAGRGNNGGDGFVIARYLAQKGLGVTVFLLAHRSRVRGDAAENLALLKSLDILVVELPDQKSFSTSIKINILHQDILVDAILGTGLKSDVKGYFKKIIEFVNGLNKPVFSVDIPSGLNSDTGQPCGVCVRAHTTATFAYPKTGHILCPGADYSGNLEVVDIGIPLHVAEEVSPGQHLLTPEMIRSYIQPRPSDAHKGNAGHLLVIAGSEGKTGAAAMTAVSAMRVGAGLVTLGIPRSLNRILETQLVEVMTCPLPETATGALDEFSFDTIQTLLDKKKCLAIGPGLGTSIGTGKLIHKILRQGRITIVIDADGLNHLAEHIELLKGIGPSVILTPHPGEMARLMRTSVDAIQTDRINCARRFATKFNVHVVLKGAKTVIAHPDGPVFVNPTGNPGMASGGMGDVLTGMIGGFVTQGYPIESATHLAVFIHGAAGDFLAKKNGPIGYLATDVMKALPNQIKDLVVGI